MQVVRKMVSVANILSGCSFTEKDRHSFQREGFHGEEGDNKKEDHPQKECKVSITPMSVQPELSHDNVARLSMRRVI